MTDRHYQQLLDSFNTKEDLRVSNRIVFPLVQVFFYFSVSFISLFLCFDETLQYLNAICFFRLAHFCTGFPVYSRPLLQWDWDPVASTMTAEQVGTEGIYRIA